MPTKLAAIDPKVFWRALGMRAIGGAVVTARKQQSSAGFLAFSVTHLTQNPPTLMLSIGKKTSALATSGRRDISRSIISRRRIRSWRMSSAVARSSPESDRFRAGSWHELLTGAPVLKGAVGTIECRLVEEIDRYDSVIAIGEIVNWTFDASVQPLVYFSGGLR